MKNLFQSLFNDPTNIPALSVCLTAEEQEELEGKSAAAVIYEAWPSGGESQGFMVRQAWEKRQADVEVASRDAVGHHCVL